MTEPMVNILYSVPYVMFLPIIIFWFGIDNTSRVIVIVWAAILPLIINITAGVRNLDSDYTRVATVFCTPRLKFFYTIALPATLPYILAGMRLAVGRALVGAIVAELFLASQGLGYFVQTQTSNFNMDSAMAGIVHPRRARPAAELGRPARSNAVSPTGQVQNETTKHFLAAGLLLGLTACSPAARKRGQTVAADANGALPVKIGYTALGAGYSDLYIAAGLRHLRQARPEREAHPAQRQLAAGRRAVPATASRSASASRPDTAAAIMKGADLKYVAMSEPHYNLEMWASPDIKSVADLKGKKVAITSPGSESDFGLTALLEANGIKR